MLTENRNLIISVHQNDISVKLIGGLALNAPIKEEIYNAISNNSNFFIHVINCFDCHEGLECRIEMSGTQFFPKIKFRRE